MSHPDYTLTMAICMLFIVNYLPDAIEDERLRLYVDDTTISFSVTSNADLNQKVTRYMDMAMPWLVKNKLTVI